MVKAQTDRRLILFPGLAADERMYAKLGELSIAVVTPRLLIPETGESMADYAHRHSVWLDIRPDDIVGGCSFGSMVASEICRQQPVRALVLLSGALSSQTLVSQSHQLNRFGRFVPFVVMRKLLMSTFFLKAVFGSAEQDDVELGRTMIAQTPKELLVRGGQLAASYDSLQPLQCDVFSLHGGVDRVLEAPAIENGEQVDNAGHGMVVSHAPQVTEFLCRVCERLAGA